MKLTLDTDKKLVTIHEEISFKQIETIKKLIGETWKDWKFYVDPVIVYKDNWWYYPSYPYYHQPITIYSNPFSFHGGSGGSGTFTSLHTGAASGGCGTTSINLIEN